MTASENRPPAAALLCILLASATGAPAQTENLVANGDFRGPVTNGLPAGWLAFAARPALAPEIRIVDEDGRRLLHLAGGGNPDCVGGVVTQVCLAAGQTYWFRVRFKMSAQVNPIRHLLFDIAAQGSVCQIVEFHRLDGEWAEGEARVSFPGAGLVKADMRALLRLCPNGHVWLENVALTETDPVPPRWVRVACTGGPDTLEKYGLPAFRQALDVMGQAKVDLALLPEYFAGEDIWEPLSGPSATLMSAKAREYCMYVAGTIGLHDEVTDRLYNAALLFDRAGKLVGRYDKLHLYGPELHTTGVTPGADVPVFKTDFGRVGVMTCSDSWFTDVAELLALRGADIILFPSLNYDRALMHARALDNCINIVASSRAGGCGIWDAGGIEIRAAAPAASQGSTCKDVTLTTVDGLDILMVTLDLNVPRNGGSRSPAVRTRRHGANLRAWLEDQIGREKDRWWVD